MSDCYSAAERNDLERFMQGLRRRNPGEEEFHQAVEEVAKSVFPFQCAHEAYQGNMLFERLTEPDRIISFRVTWLDDDNNVRVNRAWRVQFSNHIGPYKGGLRFSPSVTESVLKFLGFEQCFKNALTGLPLGGAKGGANFNPKGKSECEIMRFCHALMTELHRHIGEDIDIPAGDIGVGAREIGYLFGYYKRIANRFAGIITGKGLTFGGSAVRTEAAGYGVLYFVREMLEAAGDGLEGKKVAISGAGNVARYAAEKAVDLGAKVLTLSDSDGLLHAPDGFDREAIDYLHRLKEDRSGRVAEAAGEIGCEYHEGAAPWGVACDIALPCATQNELDLDGAKSLVDNGCRLVAEGANMPVTPGALEHLRAHDVLFAPGKAANAGGVAVSGLERAQNAQRLAWEADEVDHRLERIMREIHSRCREEAEGAGDGVDYLRGANVVGFRKLADALLAQGVT